MIQLRPQIATGFDQLPASALALFAAAPSYDLTLPWLQTMARHTLGAAESPELLWLEDAAERAVALLPMVRRDEGAFPVHRRGLRALSNYYSGGFAPLVAGESDRVTVAHALARSLVRDVDGWESLDLNPIDSLDPLFAGFERALSSDGCFVQHYFRFGNWYLELDGRSYADYVAGLSSRLQNTLKRKARKLDRLGVVSFEIVQSTSGLDAALTAYEEVYAKSWKRAEAYPAFIREMAHAFAERGWLRLGVLSVGAQVAATQLWFVYNHVASIFKLAYDPEYTEHSVGSLLTARLMEHVIDVDRVHVVDYLSGDDAYKRDWMSARRERSGIRAYRLRSVCGFALAARSVAEGWARRGLSVVRRGARVTE